MGKEWNVVAELGSVLVREGAERLGCSVESDGALVEPENLIGDCECLRDIVGDDDCGEPTCVPELKDLLKNGVSPDWV